MSYTINYTITSGELPVTVELIGSGLSSNNHASYGSYSFTNVPAGTYNFLITDSLLCTSGETLNIPMTTTTTTTFTGTLKNNLVSVWELDESSGTTVNDSYGVNTGTNTDATLMQGSLTNLTYSYLFNGTTANIDVGDIPVTSDMSAFVWVNASAVGGWIFGNYDGTGDNRGWAIAYLTSNAVDRLMVTITSDGTFNASSVKRYATSSGVNTGEWHHFGFTFTANTLKIYLDGVEVASPEITYNGTVNSIFDGIYNTRIGSNSTAGVASGFFTGYIDQPVLYSKVLTDSEILQLYNSGNGLAYVNW